MWLVGMEMFIFVSGGHLGEERMKHEFANI